MKGTLFRNTALGRTIMKNTELRGNVLRGYVLRGIILTEGKLITDGTIYGKAICENFIITGTVIKALALFDKQCVLTRFGFRPANQINNYEHKNLTNFSLLNGFRSWLVLQ